MKKVFLLMKYYLNPAEKTPFPKFDHQISALKEMGHNVFYLGIEQGTIYLCSNDCKKEILKLRTSSSRTITTLLTYDDLYRAVIKVFKEERGFDIAYVRAMPTTYSYANALETIKKSGCKLVVEIPTYPMAKEFETEKRLIRKLYFRYSYSKFVKYGKFVDLFTLIGERATEFCGRPALNIENGISLSDIPLRNPCSKKDEVHLLGLATLAHWHGYDRIIEGLCNYYHKNNGKKKVVFHIIGTDGDGSLARCENLVKEYNLKEYVIFEGPQYGESLNWFFNNCQLAIGSIGLHRTGFSVASTLKVREYMSRGLPFVLSSKDQSIDDSFAFYCKVPEDESPIDIERLIKFANDIDNNKELSKNMREYVEKNMTWEKQYGKVFSYLDSIV